MLIGMPSGGVAVLMMGASLHGITFAHGGKGVLASSAVLRGEQGGCTGSLKPWGLGRNCGHKRLQRGRAVRCVTLCLCIEGGALKGP